MTEFAEQWNEMTANATAETLLEILIELNQPTEPAPGFCECGRQMPCNG